MIVIFVSQCEKNALKRTRRVLDAFANRIGNNTWQTVITEEGLLTVKKMLRQTASKNTAVSCHWIRSRARSDLLWIVGNRNQFNEMGYVAVNSTEQDLLKSEVENDWHYLPLIETLSKIAGLLHDWGKSTVRFQKKLADAISQIRKTKPKGDPIRHEYISCLLFTAFVRQALEKQKESGDKAWIDELLADQLQEKHLQKSLTNDQIPFENLPDAASLIIWLIISHHKLPLLIESETKQNNSNAQSPEPNSSIQALMQQINSQWGYDNQRRSGNESPAEKEKLNKWYVECFQFEAKKGLITQSKRWLGELQSATQNLKQQLPLLQQAFADGSWRLIAHHARLCLMLGDHYYSSKAQDNAWQPSVKLIANTVKLNDEVQQKQYLDEHLHHVAEHAVEAARMLPDIHTQLNYAGDIEALNPSKKTSEKFQWQDNAVKTIKKWRKEREDIAENDIQCGVFIVNMASTGCGKTLANAKIMQALSPDQESLRFTLALGLRTLTLQTGDEYRERAGLANDEMAVLIGSRAVKELHEQAKSSNTQSGFDKNKKVESEDEFFDDVETDKHFGSLSAESLLDESEELDWTGYLPDEILTTVLKGIRERQFLYAPVLVCTIDHIIAATETKRGGRYILPSLRLLSSDLVIDEVDDFTGSDLIAIGRLIFLAGMLGRKVMISSATIPPDLALGFFNAYQKGWQLYAISHKKSAQIACMWFDENPKPYKSAIELIACGESSPHTYQKLHHDFIENRVKHLHEKIVQQRAKIIRCDAEQSLPRTQETYFSHIRDAIFSFHEPNSVSDPQTGIQVSLGVIRMANITPCIQLTRFLMNTELPKEIEIRVMAYHSQQVLLLRHEQEKYLDLVLNRKGDHSPLNNPIIKDHLVNIQNEQPEVKHLIFILVATPVEEVGRDHDFDWAIIEPSSMRSIIQLAGRVRRHRDEMIEHYNIGIMQYNLKGFLEHLNGKKPEKAVFQFPGYETDRDYRLNSHDLSELTQEDIQFKQGITAIARIQKPLVLDTQNSLSDLEHTSTRNTLDIPEILGESKVVEKSNLTPRRMHRAEKVSFHKSGSHQLTGFINNYWWMTAQSQFHHRFRASHPTIKLFYLEVNDQLAFYEFHPKQGLSKRDTILGIRNIGLKDEEFKRLWLTRDYSDLLTSQLRKQQVDDVTLNTYLISRRFGEIAFINWGNNIEEFAYNDNLGLFKLE